MFSIAIDGPAGSGKSTIAKLLASKLNIEYIDTGAMYRAIALKCLRLKINTDEEIKNMLADTEIDFINGKIYMDSEDVSELIRTKEISTIASDISKIAVVRKKLVEIQQKLASKKAVVMEGRDIGTVVLKNAKYKFFLTASIESRAKRRYEQMLEDGIKIDLNSVKEDILARDYNDEHRKNSPLKMADDAILLDNSNMTLEETLDFMLNVIRGN
ncbi:cytidylate kinase [Anaerosphaera aminiphila DSM 21120]|uniref:Cytidylate kinase n=1 Tax=Anaerosphaera aminiphila DSM 21120 TaxID=1120995 RepID=A0A1M5P7T8_9FIRM|nr:(d)CMP kinase [Anaerosphaera aminiphila]SHG97901.1 cytidylate kinase [Anaerosphaera aminiphila DSM 21120]